MTTMMGALAASDLYRPAEEDPLARVDAREPYRGVRLDPGIRRAPGDTAALPAAQAFGEGLGELLVPQTPVDVALALTPGRVLRPAYKLATWAAMNPAEAHADRLKGMGKVLGLGPSKAEARKWAAEHYSAGETELRDPRGFVPGAIRVANPGVYKRPDVIAREAAERVEPEHPAMKELFGVTRDDLYEISQKGARPGNIETQLWEPTKGKPSYAAEGIMSPANAQRIVDTLAEAQKHPELIKGMDPWYVMDPLYRRMEQLFGPERAVAEYRKFNATMTPFSAGSAVPVEINRGTAARMMLERGRYPQFMEFAGKAEKARGADFPEELRDVLGHAYHGVQAPPVQRWIDTGAHGYAPDTVKIPLYTDASGVPQTGFQTRLPVPDAHFTRALGMPDVRRSKNFNDYMGGTEYRPVGPWFRENVARPLGIEAVPAQARMWGTFAPQTGVDTPIGAGKLELISRAIWERARRLGVDPATFRDQVLRGQQHSALEPSTSTA